MNQGEKTSFQSLEVNPMAAPNKEGNSMVANIMRKSGYQPSKGLGARLQGVKAQVDPPAEAGLW